MEIQNIELPTALELAKANLEDTSPYCRHLMLLTESSAALRLLFECGLLKRNKTVVLVGSQFLRDVNSELRMVHQINEVKRAMRNGYIVVLVNHEGIFPSLYDVLNMRYMTKKSTETGKTTRKLRLAVGNRSQWCSVGDGFKIIVVVETKDAYGKLDLPLLNRFEKQMLRPEDALDDEVSKILWQNLKDFAREVEEKTGVKEPFVGIYHQSLASLVLWKIFSLNENVKLSFDHLYSMKQELIGLISPLARIRTTCNDSLFEACDLKASNLFYWMSYCLEKKFHLVVLTFSSSRDFELLMNGREKDYSDAISLAGVTSEREFVQALKQSRSERIQPVRFIQCDPGTISQETIEHARYLAVQELDPTEISVFLVHLPPGGKKKRAFNVDFQTGWKVIFIDDLCNPDFMSLVNTTPLSWAESSELETNLPNIIRVVKSKISVILTQARIPIGEKALNHSNMRERIQEMLKLLDEPIFIDTILNGVVRDILASMKPDEHVDLVASGEVRAGTVINSLRLALETLIIKAFSLALRWFDTNFNLSLLLSEIHVMKELWVVLSVPPPREFQAIQQDDRFVRNTGKPGFPVIAKFPWSWRIYETFQQVASTSLSNDQIHLLLTGIGETVFGTKFEILANEFCEEYLHDICSFNRRPDISLTEQLYLTKTWLVFRYPSCLTSIYLCHEAFYKESWHLFAILSIRSCLTPLNFPDCKLEFDNESSFMDKIAAFLVSPESLLHKNWNNIIDSIQLHVLDIFLEPSSESWYALLFRKIYSQVLFISPIHLKQDFYIIPIYDMKQRFREEEFHSFLKLACKEIVRKPTFQDTSFLRNMIAYIKLSSDRTLSLIFLYSLFCHRALSEEIIDEIRNDPELYSCLIDLADDLVLDRSFFPPSEVMNVIHARNALKNFVFEENVPVIQTLSSKAFFFNELSSLYGDFGTLDIIRTQPRFLSFFESKYTVDEQPPTKNKRSIDVQRINAFALIFGEALWREALTMVTNYSVKEFGEGFSRNEVTTLINEILALTYITLSKSSVQERLWNQPLSNEHYRPMQFHILILALIMAAAAKSLTEENLDMSLIRIFLTKFIECSDPSRWSHHRHLRDRPIYLHLLELACQSPHDPAWKILFQNHCCSDFDKFVILCVCAASLVSEDMMQPSLLCDILRGAKDNNVHRCFIPAMMLSEFEQIQFALGYVGWWACPNGHKYAVGECTMPMERSKCPECHSSVGGESHIPVKGVTRLDIEGSVGVPGYFPYQNFSKVGEPLRELRQVQIAFYQFCFHCLLLVGLAGPHSSSTSSFLNSYIHRSERREHKPVGQIEHLYLDYWKIFVRDSYSEKIKQQDKEVHFLGILALCARGNFKPFKLATDSALSPSGRLPVESDIKNVYFESGASVETVVMTKIDEVKKKLGVASLKHDLGKLVSNEVIAESERLLSDQSRNSSNISYLSWRYRVEIDFTHLRHQVELNRSTYPFLTKFCKIEPKLKLVSHLADILEWLRILNEALSHRKRRLSREEAAILSNERALIEGFTDEHQKSMAFDVLKRFVIAFNESFILVPNLYECERNPFLTEETPPQVDLSGGKGQLGVREEMSFKTPVCFSLTSIVQGDADAPSLCLFQLIRVLQHLNNTLIEELIFSETGVDVGQRNLNQEDLDLPITSMNTPREAILSRLIDYQRERDLQPILVFSSGKAYGLGLGVTRHIDLKSCFASIKQLLLKGKQPLRIVIPHFEYAGEVRRSGTLAGLKNRIQQITLNPAVLFSVSESLDSDSKIQPLYEIVDAAIGFLSGFSGFDGDTLFGDFCKNVLQIEDWEVIAPIPIQQQIRLCHLAAFFALLEEARNGSPLENVHPRYRKALPSGEETRLRSIAQKLNLNLILPIIKDLLISRLSTDFFPEDAPLIEYLEYSTDLDLSKFPWYICFPADIPLSQAYETYRIWLDST